MATAKKVAKKATTTTTASTLDAATQAALLQSVTILAHAKAATLKLAVGDNLYVGNYVNTQVNGVWQDRYSQDLPYGSTAGDNRSTVNSMNGNTVAFLGINDRGEFMVRDSYGRRDVAIPHTFAQQASQKTQEIRRGSEVKLNGSYVAQVLNDGNLIAVGCQRFETAKLRALLTQADTVITAQKTAGVTKRTVHVATAKPAATYVATPKPVVAKKVAKKAVTKAVAKK